MVVVSFLWLSFVCLSVPQRKHGVVDMAEPVVKPGGCRQFSCQTVGSTDTAAMSCCWLIFLPSSFLRRKLTQHKPSDFELFGEVLTFSLSYGTLNTPKR